MDLKKRCPFCDEENLESDVVCQHCNEAIESAPQTGSPKKKPCPYCQEEILSSAIKCKYCNEWLNDKQPSSQQTKQPLIIKQENKTEPAKIKNNTKDCPVCAETILDSATRCKHCGTWLNEFSKMKYEGSKVEKDTDDDSSVSHASTLIYIESAIIYAVLYFIYDFAWWKGLIGLIIAYILFSSTVVRLAYCLAVSFLWGFLALIFAPIIFDESDYKIMHRIATDSYGDYWWFAIIVGVISLLIHLPVISRNYNNY